MEIGIMALYDPAPRETVVSPDFTVADVLAWARTKPADEGYNFCDSSACAIAQFGLETGRNHLVGVSDLGTVLPGFNLKLLRALSLSETFGDLVKRLGALSA